MLNSAQVWLSHADRWEYTSVKMEGVSFHAEEGVASRVQEKKKGAFLNIILGQTLANVFSVAIVKLFCNVNKAFSQGIYYLTELYKPSFWWINFSKPNSFNMQFLIILSLQST